MNPADMFKEELDTIGEIPGVLYRSKQIEEGEEKNFEGFMASYARFPFSKTTGKSANFDMNVEYSNYVRRSHIDDEPVFILDTAINWSLLEDEMPSLCDTITEFGLDVDAMINVTWRSKNLRKSFIDAVTKYGMEALGYYVPWHRNPIGTDEPWGIHLNTISIIVYANELCDQLEKAGITLPKRSDYVQLAHELVLRHELFHFRVERFAIAQEVIQRRPVYKPYERNVFRSLSNTPLWLEEALAQACVLGSLESRPILGIDGKALREAITPMFEQMPAGYRDFECSFFGGPSGAHKRLGAQIVSGQQLTGFDLTDIAWPEAQSLSCPVKPRPSVYLDISARAASQFQTPMPKQTKTERFLAKCGFKLKKKSGVGDHKIYKNEAEKKVTINYKHGVLDIASAKALAKLVEMSLHETLRAVSVC